MLGRGFGAASYADGFAAGKAASDAKWAPKLERLKVTIKDMTGAPPLSARLVEPRSASGADG